MRIEYGLVWAAQWYFLLVPTLCVFFDRNERSFGVALAWLNFMAGIQASKNKITINKEKKQ